MSYCTLPRLAFSGQFQADVSTVNNDVRHYDVSTFEPRFQNPQAGSEMNGWWNPDGTGAFRLVDVKVTQVLAETGADGTTDPAHGLFVNAPVERTSAKLVDLDPQFQMGSAIFGLRIVLTDGETEYMRGDFRWSAFRDIYFGRKPSAGGSASASARFTSTLTDVTWTEAADVSPILTALRTSAEANDQRLSINLTTFGYSGGSTLGAVIGAIGTYNAGEPETFVSARRMAVSSGKMSNELGIGYFDGEVLGGALSLDLSNALSISTVDTQLRDVGTLFAAILRETDTVTGLGTATASVTPGVQEGESVQEAQLKLLGEIKYRDANWLQETSGIADMVLDTEAVRLIADHPIALVQPLADGRFLVGIRETLGGLFVRADQFEFRMDPPKTGSVAETARLRAMQWGRPLDNALIGFQLAGKVLGGGTGGGTNQPAAKVPYVNFPCDRINYEKSVLTGPDGWATNLITAIDPGNPRVYIDGQLYHISYELVVQHTSPQQGLDIIILHVRDAFETSAQPDWKTDIAPFMKQYGNLYPIMSKWLFSLSSPDIVKQHATILTFAFNRPLHDPNHMPVTRDMSAGKRQAILAWLAQYTGEAPLEAPKMMEAAVAIADDTKKMTKAVPLAPVPDEVLKQMLVDVGSGYDGKTNAMRDYLTMQLSESARRAKE